MQQMSRSYPSPAPTAPHPADHHPARPAIFSSLDSTFASLRFTFHSRDFRLNPAGGQTIHHCGSHETNCFEIFFKLTFQRYLSLGC